MQELIGQLTSQLGIGQDQAKGGVGAILNMAKSKLSGGELDQVKNTLGGGADEAMALAEQKTSGGGGGALGGMLGGGGGGLGGMLGGLAGAGGGLGQLAGLAGAFKAFNLDSGMVGRFVPIVMQFLQAKGGDGVKGILGKLM